MKDLIVVLAVVVVAVLALENLSKRKEAQATERQIRELIAERDELKHQLSIRPAPAATPASTWFQERVKERPSALDQGAYNRTRSVPYYYYDSYGRRQSQ